MKYTVDPDASFDQGFVPATLKQRKAVCDLLGMSLITVHFMSCHEASKIIDAVAKGAMFTALDLYYKHNDRVRNRVKKGTIRETHPVSR